MPSREAARWAAADRARRMLARAPNTQPPEPTDASVRLSLLHRRLSAEGRALDDERRRRPRRPHRVPTLRRADALRLDRLAGPDAESQGRDRAGDRAGGLSAGARIRVRS